MLPMPPPPGLLMPPIVPPAVTRLFLACRSAVAVAVCVFLFAKASGV
jgi:hypothetical protein